MERDNRTDGDRAGGNWVEEVRDVIAAQLPGYRIDSLRWLGEGMENLAYDVNGEWIVRFSKEPDPARRAAGVDREARLLAVVAGVAPLPVPEPRFTVPERGCLVYPKLPGEPLLDRPRSEWVSRGPSVAAVLGELLAALHAVPVDRLAGLVDVDDQPLAGWRQDAVQSYATVAERVPPVHRRSLEAFLAHAPPVGEYERVFSHNDLGIEHVLVDPVRPVITGIIDWGDAAIDDPAYDFGLLYRDLGPDAARIALNGYRSDRNQVAAIAVRAAFYARCSVLEDLAYGMATGREKYVDKSLAAMEWLFPVQ
jgi:aminoglycoside phosphotransferase (APT) family kinase protein